MGQRFAFGKIGFFPLVRSPARSCIRAGVNCISGNQSSRRWGCLLVFALLLSLKHCPSAGFAFPSAWENTSPRGTSLPRDSQAALSVRPFPWAYPEDEVLQRWMLPWRVYLMPIMPSLGTNPVKIHLELAAGVGDGGGGQGMGCRGCKRNGEMGRFNSVIISLPVCFGGVFFLLNAGKKPFRRMQTTTLQHFPPVPGMPAECRAAFGGEEVAGNPSTLLHPPPCPRTVGGPAPPEGSHLPAASPIIPVKQTLRLSLCM